jgi:hypothetical protein
MEEFLSAIAEVREAQRELKECEDGCEYDAGYYCSEKRDEVEAAIKKAEDIFNNMVDARLKVAQQ